jgi:Spy/CpxP family protein refolding chaperone
MKLTQVVSIVGVIGMLAAPGLLYAHCGSCGVGDAKSGAKGSMDQEPLAMMTKELNLTADQQAKIKAIKEDAHKQMESMHKDVHSKISAVLTKDQQTKLEKMPSMCKMCDHSEKGASHKH